MTQSGHGRKADIWSVGATVMQMRTAVPPWKAHKFDSIIQLMCHIAGDPTAIPMLPSENEIGFEVHSFLVDCFQRDHTKRPTATQLSSHCFLALNESAMIEENEDPMMNTLAMIQSSWDVGLSQNSTERTTTKGGGGSGGSGGSSGGNGSNSNGDDGKEDWSVMSDLSLSFAVNNETFQSNEGAKQEEKEINKVEESTEGSQNPFASNSQHLETEGSDMHGKHLLASQSNGNGNGRENDDDDNGTNGSKGGKGGSEIRGGSPTTGNRSDPNWKEHYQKLTDETVEAAMEEHEEKAKKTKKNTNKKNKKNKPLRPGSKKWMAESLRKQDLEKMKATPKIAPKNAFNQVGDDDGNLSWKDREERPIMTKAHAKNVETLKALEIAKEEADRKYMEGLEMSKTISYDLSGMDDSR